MRSADRYWCGAAAVALVFVAGFAIELWPSGGPASSSRPSGIDTSSESPSTPEHTVPDDLCRSLDWSKVDAAMALTTTDIPDAPATYGVNCDVDGTDGGFLNAGFMTMESAEFAADRYAELEETHVYSDPEPVGELPWADASSAASEHPDAALVQLRGLESNMVVNMTWQIYTEPADGFVDAARDAMADLALQAAELMRRS